MANLANAQIKELKEAFDLFDKDQSGLIDAKELKSVFKALDIDVTDEEFDILFKQMDRSGDGNIRFDEFAKAMGGSKSYAAITNDDIAAAFKRFDKDNSGFLTADEVYNVMKNFRGKVTKEECDKLIKTVDKDKDGKLKIDEFLELFK